MKIDNRFLMKAMEILEEMRIIRRDLHQHPELGMKEHRTAKLISDYLNKLGLEVKAGIGGTGVVGLLLGRTGKRTVALRADIDALPMQDRIDKDYVSKNPGIAHSCGHDAHTAMQIGVAKILSQVRDQLPGNVKFIFQPSEDTLPGGAIPMIEDGVLNNPNIEGIFSLHLNPLFSEGKVAVKRGRVSTSSVSFTLTIYGRGGHVSTPHRTLNPLLLSALVMTNTQSILPKTVEPGESLILEFASIHGGTVGNIVPSEVVMKGNIRISSSELLEEMIKRFETLVKGIVESANGKYRMELQKGYPTIFNNFELVKLWKNAASKIAGKDNIVEYDKIVTIGDDIAYFHQHIPGVYWWLGIRSEEKGFVQSLHSPDFDFNEDVMAKGAAIQAQAAWDFLHAV